MWKEHPLHWLSLVWDYAIVNEIPLSAGSSEGRGNMRYHYGVSWPGPRDRLHHRLDTRGQSLATPRLAKPSIRCHFVIWSFVGRRTRTRPCWDRVRSHRHLAAPWPNHTQPHPRIALLSAFLCHYGQSLVRLAAAWSCPGGDDIVIVVATRDVEAEEFRLADAGELLKGNTCAVLGLWRWEKSHGWPI